MMLRMFRTVLVFSALAAHGEQLTFMGKTDKHPLSYAVGEPMAFTVRLVDKDAGDAPVKGRKLVWKTEGDDGAKQSGEATSDEPLVVMASASKPGFVRLTVNVLGEDGKVLGGKCEKFDGSAGADVTKIEAWPEPADFDAFWAKRLAAVAAQTGGTTACATNVAKGFTVRTFSLPMGAGENPATGFIAIPVGAKPKSLRIDARFHGYGFGPVFFTPNELKKDAICLSVTRQGEAIGREKAYYDELKATMKGFCFRNTASPDTTDQLKMLLRDWRALQWAKTLPEWNGKDVAVAGGSMGGYQALAMAALDPGVTSAWAYIPWHACLAGKAKFGRMGGWAPDWTEALGYFDTANFAARITCPVTMTIGLGDYTCPPSGEMVLFRNLKGKKKMTVRQNMGHGSDYGVKTAIYVVESDVGGYVPEPKPMKSDVEITAIYYPGTEQMSEWDVIAQTCPERKPLLGWFDEGNPEAIDWQIKWAVEHGITSFCVDWYWNKGYTRLTHWVKGYYKARYRKYLKWFMMYANHNQPGSHSTEDQIAVTKYWIENYFKTPEYYTVEGKPAVCYWDAENLDRDFIAEAAAKGETLAPGEGIRRAFAISEKLVKEAGLPGIYWIDMWRTFKFDRAYAEKRVSQGYRAAIHYGIEEHAGKIAPEAMKPGDKPRHFDYDVVMAAAPKIWDELSVQDTLPYWVILPTGWDDRPRSFGKAFVISGRTPEKFAEICRQARAFCDKHGKKHVVVMPVNEWQEGSYIEPNVEYGFGMYDAIRDAFCKKPKGGWPKDVTPADVGMGPYDYPPAFRSPVPRWEFKDSVEGWYRQPYGGGELVAKDGCLHFWNNWYWRNYNIRQRVMPFDASRYRTFRVRMRVTPNAVEGMGGVTAPDLRLKWGTKECPIVGKGIVVDDTRCVASCPVVCDGAFHEYSVDLAGNSDWKGLVDELWFESCPVMHARVSVDWMRFE